MPFFCSVGVYFGVQGILFCVCWIFFIWSSVSISGNAGRAAFKNRKEFPLYKIHVHLWLEFSSSRQAVQKIFELWIRKVVILLFQKVSQVYLFSENNRAHFSSSKVIKLYISMHSFFTALSFSFWQSLSIWHERLTLFLWKKSVWLTFSSTVSHPTTLFKTDWKSEVFMEMLTWNLLTHRSSYPWIAEIFVDYDLNLSIV